MRSRCETIGLDNDKYFLNKSFYYQSRFSLFSLKFNSIRVTKNLARRKLFSAEENTLGRDEFESIYSPNLH